MAAGWYGMVWYGGAVAIGPMGPFNVLTAFALNISLLIEHDVNRI